MHVHTYVDYTLDCNATGQLGVGTTEVTCKPLRMELPEDFEAESIFCGPDSSAILGEDGQLLVCGSNRCCVLLYSVSYINVIQ